MRPDIDTQALNAPIPLTVPCYDGANQPLHPSVVFVDEGWHGWRYWMAYTPYTDANGLLENPSIAVSQEGREWYTPVGLTNPIVAAPQTGHFSDPDLVLYGDTLYLFYRWNSATGEELYYRTSADGVAWSAQVGPIITTSGTATAAMAPSIIHDGTKWLLYAVNADANPHTVRRWTADAPDGTWTLGDPLTWAPATDQMWHLDVGLESDGFWAFASHENGRLYYYRSFDGLTWYAQPSAVLGPTTTRWDGTAVHRTSAVVTDWGYILFYGGYKNDVYGIGVTGVNYSGVVGMATNQLLNASFETDSNADGLADNWVFANTTATPPTRSLVAGRFGQYAQQAVYVSGADTGKEFSISQKSAVGSLVAGQPATFSVWLKGSNTGAVVSVMLSSYAGATWKADAVSDNIVITDDWKQVSVTVPSLVALTDCGNCKIRVRNLDAGDAVTIAVDGAHLGQSATVSPFMPVHPSALMAGGGM